MRKQVKQKATTDKKPQNIKPKVRKPVSHQSSFADLHETDITNWSWIPISLLLGMLVGIIAMLLSINFFGMDLLALLEAVKNFF